MIEMAGVFLCYMIRELTILYGSIGITILIEALFILIHCTKAHTHA